jgi:hypothetical protein
MSTPSPDFLKFIGFLDYPLNATNLAYLTDLFVHFTAFSNGPNDSLEAKFIKWKRFYDASSYPLNITSPTQDLLEYTIEAINTDAQQISQTFPIVDVPPQTDQRCDYQITLSSPPPPPPPQTPASPPSQLIETNYQLPSDLIAIQNTAGCYRNFKIDNLLANTMTEHIEIMATSSPLEEKETTPSPPPQPSKGKNITQMKEIYKENNDKKKKENPPKPRPRKRKHVPSCETTELIPSTKTVEIDHPPVNRVGVCNMRRTTAPNMNARRIQNALVRSSTALG